MPRIRTIKPELPQDVKLASCSRDARYTFVLLITQADDEGFIPGAHRQLLGLLYPHDEDVTAARLIEWVEELVGIGAIRWRATVDGAPILEIVNWSKHQRVDNKGKSLLSHLLQPLAAVRGEIPRVAAVRGGSPLGVGEGPRTMDLGSGSGSGARALGANAGRLREATADHWPDFATFLNARAPDKREAWAKELLSMTVSAGAEDTAQAVRDAHLVDVTNAGALRTFVARVKRDRISGSARASPAGSTDPFTAELAKWKADTDAKESANA